MRSPRSIGNAADAGAPPVSTDVENLQSCNSSGVVPTLPRWRSRSAFRPVCPTPPSTRTRRARPSSASSTRSASPRSSPPRCRSATRCTRHCSTGTTARSRSRRRSRRCRRSSTPCGFRTATRPKPRSSPTATTRWRSSRSTTARTSDPYRIPAALEFRFTVEVEGVPIAGTIDRLDRIPGGGYEIIDYKTNRRLPPMSRVEQDLQLSIYWLAAQQVWGIEPEKLTLYFLLPGQRMTTTRTTRARRRAPPQDRDGRRAHLRRQVRTEAEPPVRLVRLPGPVPAVPAQVRPGRGRLRAAHERDRRRVGRAEAAGPRRVSAPRRAGEPHQRVLRGARLPAAVRLRRQRDRPAAATCLGARRAQAPGGARAARAVGARARGGSETRAATWWRAERSRRMWKTRCWPPARRSAPNTPCI